MTGDVYRIREGERHTGRKEKVLSAEREEHEKISVDTSCCAYTYTHMRAYKFNAVYFRCAYMV